MNIGAISTESFVLRHGPLRGNPGDLLDRRYQPAARVTLSELNISLKRSDWATTLSWPTSSIASVTLERQMRGEEDTPSFLVYSTTIEFGSGERLIVGIHQQRREFEGIGERDASAYRLFVDSLHRRIAIHAQDAKTAYRGGPLLQSVWMLLGVLIVAFLAVDRIGALLVVELVENKLPIEILGTDVTFIPIVVAWLTPGGMVLWAWRRTLKRSRRYRPDAIPAFLFPEIDAP